MGFHENDSTNWCAWLDLGFSRGYYRDCVRGEIGQAGKLPYTAIDAISGLLS